MKINTSARSRRIRTALIIFMLMLFFIFGTFLFTSTRPSPKKSIDHSKNSSQTSYQPPTDQQRSTGATIKEDSMRASNDEPTQSIFYPIITSTNSTDEKLSIRTLLNTAASTGTCRLDMKSVSGKTYTQTSEVQALPNNSTCKGFDISLKDLSKAESWHITITATIGSSKGVTETDIAL